MTIITPLLTVFPMVSFYLELIHFTFSSYGIEFLGITVIIIRSNLLFILGFFGKGFLFQAQTKLKNCFSTLCYFNLFSRMATYVSLETILHTELGGEILVFYLPFLLFGQINKTYKV